MAPESSCPRLLVLLIILSCLAHAQSWGAVYTTDHRGILVDGNTFTNARQVYLCGGPAAGSSSLGQGLPDGNYFFQVTDPSGSTLLSRDPVRMREVVVAGGVISATTGPHSERDGPVGSKIIELAPFGRAPRSGAEYKVWLTNVQDYDPRGGGFFGFQAEHSKTEGFSIAGFGPPPHQTIISGLVFYDIDEDGLPDLSVPGEVPLAGWRIELSIGGVLNGVTYTDQDGIYTFIRPLDFTTYEVTEFAPPPGYIPAAGALWLNTSPVQTLVTADAPMKDGGDFGNLEFQLAPGVGFSKGFWHNQGESLLAACDPDWRLALNGTPAEPLCLRNSISTSDPSLSIFLVPEPPESFANAFGVFSNWIVSPTMGHAGFALSSQVAATVLNNTCGMMQGTIYVDRFGTGELQSLESMVEGARTLLCDTNAGLTGPNDPCSPSPFDPSVCLRDAMLGCVNEFTAINSTSNLAEPQIVYEPRPDPGDFASPFVQ